MVTLRCSRRWDHHEAKAVTAPAAVGGLFVSVGGEEGGACAAPPGGPAQDVQFFLAVEPVPALFPHVASQIIASERLVIRDNIALHPQRRADNFSIGDRQNDLGIEHG